MAWIGLQVQPREFKQYPPRGVVPVPTYVPPTVARYYRATFGDAVSIIDSAVITALCQADDFAVHEVNVLEGGSRRQSRHRLDVAADDVDESGSDPWPHFPNG